jgi:hypothetical protein
MRKRGGVANVHAYFVSHRSDSFDAHGTNILRNIYCAKSSIRFGA